MYYDRTYNFIHLLSSCAYYRIVCIQVARLGIDRFIRVSVSSDFMTCKINVYYYYYYSRDIIHKYSRFVSDKSSSNHNNITIFHNSVK